jgi:predicted ATPase
LAGTFFATQSPIGREQYAVLFSNLSTNKREGEVLSAIRQEFPQVEGLSVELSHGVPMLFASVPYLPEKIPVTLLSSGINKLLCLLLAIASFPKGILIVDEIEIGFYFARMPHIWTMLLSFAQKFDVQIFASTHSSECLAALAQACKKKPDDAMLIRTTVEKGVSHVETFLGSSFFRGMKIGEVR